MSNLDYYVVMDLDSGTYFCATNTVLIDTRSLREDQQEALMNGCDSDISEVGFEAGTYLDELISLPIRDKEQDQ